MSEKKFRVGLGVSGGIAAYKAIEVLRGLQKAGCEVQVCMTRHATEFIQPLTFRALTEKYVLVDDYEPNNPDPIAHINFSQNIDLMLVVPATANIIAKFANGIADDFLTSTYLASTAPVLIAPAMNTTMWFQPATQRNIEQLRKDGVQFVEPVSGRLACETVGTGKLEDVDRIVKTALKVLSRKSQVSSKNKPETLDLRLATQDLLGEQILITTGGTREAIDPVRFISNHSSGKMGFAIAEEAAKRGAEVKVVVGAVSVKPPENVKIVNAISAREMHLTVMENLPDATIYIGAAAIADYRPQTIADNKIKKNNESLTIELERTTDILSEVSKNRHEGLLVVGFAAETNDVIKYARGKLEKKNLDMIVANDVTRKGAGFGSDENQATIITKEIAVELPLISKNELANRILDEVLHLRNKGQGTRD
ncbi:MAG TPA: bifunctional phosphopantothenoylcysteine decarboxylase/phosphopantothenate--cysteine ligase CoaBC [Pyrinomonadaceae bacterium]|nr:bifunctional phosphopantothenoylcysteine decarboxylase/phosphopantothenate--cysteine ligase CoaBC [Pyrinomonadaceae bacterium]